MDGDGAAPLIVSITPRRWQLEALQHWRASAKGIIEVVTGGGKTAFALFAIQDALRRQVARRVVIAVPTIALVDQWYVSFLEETSFTTDEVVRLPHDASTAKTVVSIGSYQSAAKHVFSAPASACDTFLIVDECHRIATPSHRKIIKHTYAATLGLSATPEREHDDWFQEYVVPALGPVIFQYDLSDAAADHIVSPFAIRNLRVPLASSERAEIDSLTKRIGRAMGQGDEEAAKTLLLRRQRVISNVRARLPAAAYVARLFRDRRTVIFHEENRSADIILQLLKRSGLSATIYHSGLSPTLRASNLLLYRKHMFDILVCCRALDEGLNVPDTSCAILAASSRSHRQRVQRVGRVLRRTLKKDDAIVITLYATDVEEAALQRDAIKMSSAASSIQWGNITLGG